MARKLDPQQALERARALHATQLQALSALTDASATIEGLDNTHHDEIEQLRKRHTQERKEVVSAYTTALNTATAAGWSQTQLRNLGIPIMEPALTRANRTRQGTRPRRTAPNTAAEQRTTETSENTAPTDHNDATQ